MYFLSWFQLTYLVLKFLWMYLLFVMSLPSLFCFKIENSVIFLYSYMTGNISLEKSNKQPGYTEGLNFYFNHFLRKYILFICLLISFVFLSFILTSGSIGGYFLPLLFPRHFVLPSSNNWHQNPLWESNLKKKKLKIQNTKKYF